MTDERPAQQQLPHRKAGSAQAKHVRLSPNPSVYRTDPRTEADSEDRPPATIYGPFRPIHDRGAETTVTPKRRHEPRTEEGDSDGEEAQ